jgi:prevent-host-death family protein
MSKSEFKPKTLEYLRKVEKDKVPLVLTHDGKPVVKIMPYSESDQEVLDSLRGTVKYFKNPTKPVALPWDALK